MSLTTGLQRIFWDLRPHWRRPARRLRLALSLGLHRLRRLRNPAQLPRVLPCRVPTDQRWPHPALAIHRRPGIEADLDTQTETSWTLEASGEEPLLVGLDEDLSEAPATLLESLLLSAASLPVAVHSAGLARPAEGISTAEDIKTAEGTSTSPRIVHRLAQGLHHAPQDLAVLGRDLPHLTVSSAESPSREELFTFSGPWRLRADVRPGQLVPLPVQDPFEVLQALPEIPGPRTALFLLPFLAVGGAEHLLFDLLEGLAENYRCLVVTLDTHRAHLGQTVDRCRRLTPHVYTLGDWLPREAHAGAVAHLLRRYRVEALVSWNGTVEFYDRAETWKANFPELEIFHQLYNHRGSWTERVTPRLVRAVTTHLAVNGPIAESLRQRGVPEDRIALVPHGVRVPKLLSNEDRARAQRESRQALNLPEDSVVVGTFIRFHAQKRPLDIVQLARRLEGQGVHFLLAGDGPMSEAIDRELAQRPVGNLTRFPMQNDVEPLYAATDLCLSTSSYEGLPVFLLDALARGLPCVATAVGDIPDLLRDGGGLLVERPGDLSALEAAILTLLDPARRSEEGRKGYETVRDRFGLDAYRHRYERLFFPQEKGP